MGLFSGKFHFLFVGLKLSDVNFVVIVDKIIDFYISSLSNYLGKRVCKTSCICVDVSFGDTVGMILVLGIILCLKVGILFGSLDGVGSIVLLVILLLLFLWFHWFCYM